MQGLTYRWMHLDGWQASCSQLGAMSEPSQHTASSDHIITKQQFSEHNINTIKFKLATQIHNTPCSTQPAYLHSLLNYHTPTRSLRSANTNLLSVPPVRTTFASRGFSVAAPAVWNSLPSSILDSSSTHTFRRLLETHCIQQAFGSP